MEEVESPCIFQCELNEEKYCVGCLRSVVEITGWRVMSNEQKKEVIRNVEERKRLLNENS